jgi:hypothetical protein
VVAEAGGEAVGRQINGGCGGGGPNRVRVLGFEATAVGNSGELLWGIEMVGGGGGWPNNGR